MKAPPKPLSPNERGRLDEAALGCVRNRMDRRSGAPRLDAHRVRHGRNV